MSFFVCIVGASLQWMGDFVVFVGSGLNFLRYKFCFEIRLKNKMLEELKPLDSIFLEDSFVFFHFIEISSVFKNLA